MRVFSEIYSKSLFLNALMCQTILPSDGALSLFDYLVSKGDHKAELPSTAWPCRLRHVPGQSVPTLTFDPEPFRVGLKELQDKKIGLKMQDYKPPSDDPFDDTFDNNPPNPLLTANEDCTAVYYNWKDLHQQTRKNLLEFENPSFDLPSSAKGRDQVTKLVSILICDKFDSQRFKMYSLGN